MNNSSKKNPQRGDVWLIQFNPTRGHEQSGMRPAVILSADLFNEGHAGLVVALPITTKRKFNPLHVEVDMPEGGLKERSYIKYEDIRSLSIERLQKKWGNIESDTLMLIEDRVRILLDL